MKAIPLLILSLISKLTFASVAHSDQSNAHLDKQYVNGHSQGFKRLSEEPLRVEIINRAQIEALHATDLSEVLKYSSGIKLQKLTGKEGFGVSLQGMNADRVAILIDGLPLAAGTGSSVDVTQIAVSGIERIEISKGAMSSIYGTNAMGGVINVITKTPEKGISHKIQYQGGSWGDQDLPKDEFSIGNTTYSLPMAKHHLNANIASAKAQQYVQLNADIKSSSGFRIPNNNVGTQGWDGYQAQIAAKAHLELDEATHVTIQPRRFKEHIKTTKDNPIGGIGNVPKDRINITEKQYFAAQLERKNADDATWATDYISEHYENESRQDLQNTAFIEQQRFTSIEHQSLRSRYSFYDQKFNHYSIGYEWLHDQMNVLQLKRDDISSISDVSLEVPNRNIENHNLTFLSNVLLSSNWETMLSAYINHNPKYGEEISPMLNIKYTPNLSTNHELSFRVGISKGYRTPTLKELYYEFDHSHLGYVVLGNDRLEPERSVNIQSSIEWRLNQNHNLDINFFYNDIEDLIDLRTDEQASIEASDYYGNDVSASIYSNISNAETKGVEINYRANISTYLSTQLSYNYLSAINKSTNLDLVSKPKNSLKASFDFFLTHKLKMSFHHQYTGSQYSDSDNLNKTSGFSSNDIKINYHWSKDLHLFSGINNINNTQKTELDGNDQRPEEGRYIYFGLSLQ